MTTPERSTGILGPRTARLVWYLFLVAPLAILAYGARRMALGPAPGRELWAGIVVSLIWVAGTLWLPRTAFGRAFVERFALKLALLGCVVALTLLVAETGLRLHLYGTLSLPPNRLPSELRETHPTRGWCLTPGAAGHFRSMAYDTRVRINSRGLRDVEHEYDKPPGTFRIVVLGDSYMEAYHVDLEQSLPRLLERELTGRNVEVINLGTGGYGTAQELLYLEEEGLRYEPDLILLAFYFGNDLRNNHRALETLIFGENSLKSFGRPYAAIDENGGGLTISVPDYERARAWVERARQRRAREIADQPLLDGVLIARLIQGALHDPVPYDPNVHWGPFVAGFDGASGDGRPAEDYERMWNEAWEVTEGLVLRISEVARENGAEPALFLVPDAIQTEQRILGAVRRRFPALEIDLTRSHERMLAFGARHDLPVLDLLPHFHEAMQRGEGPLFPVRGDLHWNAAGHRVAARELARYLEEHGLVPPPP